jgi:hypothetical protein
MNADFHLLKCQENYAGPILCPADFEKQDEHLWAVE